MRGLLLAAVLLAALAAPEAAAAPDACFGGPAVRAADSSITCERVDDSTCRFALLANGTTPLDAREPCPPHTCMRASAGDLARVSCESRRFPNNATQRSTTLDVTIEESADERVPAGHLQARASRSDAPDGSSASACRVQYDRSSGPGPSRIEAGQPCVYPFLLP